MGKSGLSLTAQERIITGLFLSSQSPNPVLNSLRPEWDEKATVSIEEKETFLSEQYPLDEGDRFVIDKVFPWAQELSNDINHVAFCKSFFIQPDVFIRVRPGYEQKVSAKLKNENIEFLSINKNCISVPQATKLDKILELDREAVIQDYNSQLTANYFPLPAREKEKQKEKEFLVWDACAASGGKSIMAYDLDPSIQLTVSDVRASILANLRERFKRAGIKNYRSIDLSKENLDPAEKYDLVICDVPCTGSGTWSRTPEQLYFFETTTIDDYAHIQKKIVSSVVRHLKPGGQVVYITCSVFRKENEDIVEHFKQAGLTVNKMELLKGYASKADSMFVSLLTS